MIGRNENDSASSQRAEIRQPFGARVDVGRGVTPGGTIRQPRASRLDLEQRGDGADDERRDAECRRHAGEPASGERSSDECAEQFNHAEDDKTRRGVRGERPVTKV